jgi:hypothetical protein
MFTVRAVKLSGLLADFEICELLQRPHHGRVIPALAAMRDAGIEQLLRGGSVWQKTGQTDARYPLRELYLFLQLPVGFRRLAQQLSPVFAQPAR